MIYIDLDADLNLEDDDILNVTTVPMGVGRPKVGSALVAGRLTFWSWVIIDAVEENPVGTATVTFHQVSVKEAASLGPLVVDLPDAG